MAASHVGDNVRRLFDIVRKGDAETTIEINRSCARFSTRRTTVVNGPRFKGAWRVPVDRSAAGEPQDDEQDPEHEQHAEEASADDRDTAQVMPT